MWEVFAIGTFWFYLLVATYIVTSIFLMEMNRVLLTTLVTIGTVVIITFMGNKEILSWTTLHPWYVASGFLAYILIGVVWAIIKWSFYTREIEEFIQESKVKWVFDLQGRLDEDNRRSYLNEQQKVDYIASIQSREPVGVAIQEWDKYVLDYEIRRRSLRTNWRIPKPLSRPKTMEEIKTFVDENKSKVVGWMTYWFSSLVWTFLNDPLRRLMKYLFYRIRGILEAIAARTFGVRAG